MLRIFDSNKRKVSLVTLVAFLLQIFYPTQTFALTGGPSQPEYENFEPAGATEMVNLATGDFVYNIPLMDVDGYPVNISYHGGINMEQEASWVGLGWSLNTGAINRGMRGFPDDFNGGADFVEENINILTNKTYGLGVGGGGEIVGFPLTVTAGFGIVYNNYKGLGLELDWGISGSLGASSAGGGGGLSGGLGLKVSSQDGADFTMSGGINGQTSIGFTSHSLGANRSQTRNSRRGLVSDMISASLGVGVSAFGGSFGSTTGSAINLIPNTAYTPNMQYPTTFSGITGEIHAGAEIYWANVFGYLRAHKFEEGLAVSNIKRPAFGYLNLQNGQGDGSAMLDFNRDLDGTYYLECPKLPFANLTYDVFNVNAQGLNELYRPFRNDFGYVNDPTIVGGGSAQDIGIEMNYGNLVEIGFNDYGISTNSASGYWNSGNNAMSAGVRFTGDNQHTNDSPTNYRTYEDTYFKALDELHTQDATFNNSIRGSELAAFKLQKMPGTVNSYLTSDIIGTGGTTNYTGQKRNSREPRNNFFSFLNIQEASNVGFDKQLTNYTPNTFNYTSDGDINKAAYTSFARNTGLSNKQHHISEITVTKDDGARYVYGVPVYNNKTKEVVFNCTGNTVNSDFTVDYTSTDRSISNNKGQDKFFLGRELPAYAHSYLLTALLSKDYVDITGDGATNDDYGDYTKFNYSRTSIDYGWRNPYGANKAHYDVAKRAYPNDDKGSYVFGEKELWYLHSIETKNFVAEFHTNTRDDAHGTATEDGGISTTADNTSRRLEKIVLYSKKDLTTPIKTVNFVYDYSLCQGTPNSQASGGGKLTLKKIYFTYGKSDKGVFSPYTFEYCDDHFGSADPNLNVAYDRTKMDRWGNYQTPVGSIDNRDFPYTHQDKSVADYNAHMWNLASITTPAKSKIDIFYEADDYAYLQNQTPAQMIRMIGFSQLKPLFSSNPATYNSTDLYSTNSLFSPNNYMIVDLTAMAGGGFYAGNQTEADNILRTKILHSSGKLYFKGYVQLGDNASTYDYVPGYADVDLSNSGVFTHNVTGGLYKYAYIKLKDVDIEDSKNYPGNNCNPISKAGWQILRSEYPQIAYPGSEPGGSGLSAMLGLLGAMTEVFTFKQKNGRLRNKSYARTITPNKSFVRLQIPTKTKIGGGHRVKKIEINDNWNDMVSGETSTTYGQTYTYTVSENGSTISSGVASYEPLAGGDEISLRFPVEYSVARIEAPDDAHFFEYPIGEAFYPAPVVIYSKVTVRNIDRAVTQNIGRTEYEFYTTKDFPFYSTYSDLQSETHMTEPSFNLFLSSFIESSVHLSQGFILKLNNMHGKLKSVLTFQENNSNPISGVKYHYKRKSDGSLNNTIAVMDETGTISNATIGEHVEAVADFRQQTTSTYGNSIMGNLNMSLLPVGPLQILIPIPSVFWGSSTETRDFYSSTLNKVVTQNGILEKVETISNYATNITENLVWDSKTTDVLLSRTTTNYGDSDYDYHTPAHWVYSGMGGAYKNTGYGFKNFVTLSTGQIVALSSPANELLREGDEVQLVYLNSTDDVVGTYSDRLWISKNGSGNLILINRDGKLCNTSGSSGTINVFTGSFASTVLKVIRSGYRNLISEAVESVQFSSDPRSSGTISFAANILNAEAQEYSDNWQKLCQPGDDGCSTNADLVTCFSSLPSIYDNTNPYIRNTKGNWNEIRDYTYLDKRTASSGTGVMDIRKDGVFNSYKPFFKYSSGSWMEVYNSSRSDYNSGSPFDKWIMNSEITKISPYGNVVEAKDAINRFSSSLYGFDHSLKTAGVINAQVRDIGFDSFEDYYYGLPCMENHFGFRKYKAGLVYGIAHTGRYSLKVPSNDCASTVRNITNPDCVSNYGYNNIMSPIPTPTATNDCSCISAFSPVAYKTTDQKYLLSVWVKESQLNKDGDYTDAFVEVTPIGFTNIATLVGKSPIINGWQKLDYEFNIISGSAPGAFVISLNNTSTGDVYFDDIRVQPVNSSMGSYVYDPKSLRIWSELDERNYATIYEYDNEGVLVRVKKETETGIHTIKETRNSFKKK